MNWLIRFVVLGALISTLLAGWGYYAYHRPNHLTETKTIYITPGTSFNTITEQLAHEGVLEHPFFFQAFATISGEFTRFKAGEYLFPPGLTAQEIAALLVAGKTLTHSITFAEGLTTREMLQLIQYDDLLSGDITLSPREGELLPETYHFSRGDTRDSLIRRMQKDMQAAIETAWEQRADIPLKNKEELVTLASIVEKETSVPEERPRVAAVYINRLRSGMKLQADPTTSYAITLGKYTLERPLTRNDLLLDSPYNTYVTTGLPPTPIASPGKLSLLATARPLQNDELYFVATGTGGHRFARSYEEHLANVRLLRQEQARSATN